MALRLFKMFLLNSCRATWPIYSPGYKAESRFWQSISCRKFASVIANTNHPAISPKILLHPHFFKVPSPPKFLTQVFWFSSLPSKVHIMFIFFLWKLYHFKCIGLKVWLLTEVQHENERLEVCMFSASRAQQAFINKLLTSIRSFSFG